MHKIDPGQFSWDRADFHSDRSAAQHMNIEGLKDALKGLGIGVLGGAGLGAGANLLGYSPSGNMGTDTFFGGALGGALGALTGSATGAYRGAKNYNSRVIDKL